MARTALQEYREAWKIAHIYTEEELRTLRAPDNVHLAVDAMDGVSFSDAESHRGDHGFSLREKEAKVLFCLNGPGVKKGLRLEKMHVTDIAPTLAEYLSLSLPDTDGHALNGIFD